MSEVSNLIKKVNEKKINKYIVKDLYLNDYVVLRKIIENKENFFARIF
jgi:hypothetical protein